VYAEFQFLTGRLKTLSIRVLKPPRSSFNPSQVG